MTEEEYEQTLREAFFALAGSMSPAFTKKQQKAELGRCWDILVPFVYPVDEEGEDDECR